MRLSRLSIVFLFAASAMGGLGLQLVDLGTLPWAVSRASGLAAFAVLSASVVMGLLVSTKASDGLMSRPFVFSMHQFLSVLSLVLIGVHAGSLLFDGFFQFTPLSILVPFLSPFSPLAVAAGVVAGWLAAITTASYWMRARIGQKRWRSLHYLTFLAYFAALGHGVFAGTDTTMPLVYWSYVVSAALVLGLTTVRLTGHKSTSRRPVSRTSAAGGGHARGRA